MATYFKNYRLDGEDPMLRASGNDVVDLAPPVTNIFVNGSISTFSIDNLLNKKYFETQNFLRIKKHAHTCDICREDPRYARFIHLRLAWD